MAVESPDNIKPEPTDNARAGSASLSGKPDPDAASSSSSSSSSSASEFSAAAVTSADVSDQAESPFRTRTDADSVNLAAVKSEEYRLLFRLPPEEALVEDFNCAFQENILFQGHMYLFLHHICFYSNIFGFETKKTIPFNEVTCVRKAKTVAIFPNAIEIVAGVKKYFFGSFISRDEAYRLIMEGWSRNSINAKSFSESQEAKPENSGQENGPLYFEKFKSLKRLTNDSDSVERSKDEDVPEDCSIASNGEFDAVAPEKFSEVQEEEDKGVPVSSNSYLPSKPGGDEAPKIPDCYTMVAESEFPLQVEEFFHLFFSDGGVDFVDAFHRKCGDKEFHCTSWYKHDQFGHAREITFQHPIKLYFGAKYGHCQEMQKFRFYNSSHLIVDTSQQINDVPYADYFTVEGMWDVVQGSKGENSCALRVFVNVAFSKKTIWRGKIEQSTIEECREAYATWISNAQELLKHKRTSVDESIGGTGNSYTIAQGNVVEEEISAKRETLLEELNHTTSSVHVLQRRPSLSKDSSKSTTEIDLHASASFVPSFKELGSSLWLYVKQQNMFSVAVIVAIILIFIIMQVTIIVLLFREPKIHLVPQESLLSSFHTNRAEAVAWLEKRVHHLNEEMMMVEARLDKMRLEYTLLKAHLQGLQPKK